MTQPCNHKWKKDAFGPWVCTDCGVAVVTDLQVGVLRRQTREQLIALIASELMRQRFDAGGLNVAELAQAIMEGQTDAAK